MTRKLIAFLLHTNIHTNAHAKNTFYTDNTAEGIVIGQECATE